MTCRRRFASWNAWQNAAKVLTRIAELRVNSDAELSKTATRGAGKVAANVVFLEPEFGGWFRIRGR